MPVPTRFSTRCPRAGQRGPRGAVQPPRNARLCLAYALCELGASARKLRRRSGGRTECRTFSCRGAAPSQVWRRRAYHQTILTTSRYHVGQEIIPVWLLGGKHKGEADGSAVASPAPQSFGSARQRIYAQNYPAERPARESDDAAGGGQRAHVCSYSSGVSMACKRAAAAVAVTPPPASARDVGERAR